MHVNQFRHEAVRDLAWVMQSQALLKDTAANHHDSGNTQVVSDPLCQSIYRASLRWLVEQDQDPQVLRQWLAERQSHRLGYYFEALVEYWLQYLTGDGCLYTRVPIRQGGETLGEIDFLFAEAGKKELNHWEVAVKFYLRHSIESTSENSREVSGVLWHGPNAKDRFDKKVNHLFEHQSRLARTPEGRVAIQALAEGLKEKSVQPGIFLKGYLFYPSDTDWRHPSDIPEQAFPRHLTGWWTHADKMQIPGISDNGTEPASRWCIVPRLRWLAPVLIAGEDESNIESSLSVSDLLTPQQLKDRCRQYFSENQDALLVAELQPAASGAWQELSRGFVVRDDWPKN